jgi:hypothetical protein
LLLPGNCLGVLEREKYFPVMNRNPFVYDEDYRYADHDIILRKALSCKEAGEYTFGWYAGNKLPKFQEQQQQSGES